VAAAGASQYPGVEVQHLLTGMMLRAIPLAVVFVSFGLSLDLV
jgi:hypothetical protein